MFRSNSDNSLHLAAKPIFPPTHQKSQHIAPGISVTSRYSGVTCRYFNIIMTFGTSVYIAFT